MLPKTVKRCPECGSTNITLWVGMVIGNFYFCKSCGYRGALILEEDIEEDKAKKTATKKEYIKQKSK